ncbi:MAG TPA: class I SAM-dependent methyltransferase, partial [Verrucomicrobiae bacterium]|nr:class I SAM-dependent methyltransferase [Verrucomicrobiae bacterium]
MPFNPLNHPIAFLAPRFLSHTSAWAGHIPFAMTLVDLLRPRSIVELGTHQGDSYCALCQAVAALGLATQCAAVDTWRGDDQTGHYGGEILANLREAHDPVYGRFSRLIQATFDDAAAQFPLRSIDLLHIDGLHTYAAVKHDFETWLPKMSSAGVVLFHDVNVNHRDFGVYQLWQEISRGRPNMLFDHSFGLGVLAVGNAVPAPVLEFLNEASRNPGPIKTCFARLGEAVELTRYLKTMTSWQMQTMEEVNQWKRRTGKPVDPNSTDIRSIFADVLGYAGLVHGEVKAALTESSPSFFAPTSPVAPVSKISIIICSINPEKFKAVTEMYARVMGSANFEIIGIHDAKSMAEGYNRAITQSTGDCLIFSHDDLEFITPDVPARLLNHLQNYDLVGLAGTNRLCGNTWMAAGPPFLFGQVSHPVSSGGYNVNIFGAPRPIVGQLHALDGLFIAVNRRVIDRIRFDESFTGFHFYDLDFSATAYKAGFRLAVANDLHAIHSSAGSYGPAWEAEAAKFESKWSAQFSHRPPRSGIWPSGVNVEKRE